MKKLFLLLIIAFSLCSCNNDMLEGMNTSNELASLHNSIDTCHQVHLSDVLTLVSAQHASTRATGAASSMVSCYVDKVQDTLFYVFDLPAGGWVIYSSDTRVPPIIAQGSTASFYDAMKNPARRSWIETLAVEMKIIKQLNDDVLNLTAEEIECNKTYWKAVSSPNEYVIEHSAMSTRARDSFMVKPIVKGHYELKMSSSHIETYDSIGSLLSTKWHQDYPYNLYCPLKKKGQGRAPAGCVAVAGAQMLLFLHNKLGVPRTAPSEAYCYGSVGSDYDWSQFNYTSDVWDMMEYDGRSAAPLIADVGRRVKMGYTDNGSSATTSDLVNKVFVPYEINCRYGAYDPNVLRNELLRGFPIILRASSKNEGHAFISDRYRRTRMITTNVYEWVYDEIPNGSNSGDPFLEYIPPKKEIVYSLPVVSAIGMNWGWGPAFQDESEWYSLTGSWIKKVNNVTYNWNTARAMIYGFQVISDNP